MSTSGFTSTPTVTDGLQPSGIGAAQIDFVGGEIMTFMGPLNGNLNVQRGSVGFASVTARSHLDESFDPCLDRWVLPADLWRGLPQAPSFRGARMMARTRKMQAGA